MKFLFDHNLSPHLARGVSALSQGDPMPSVVIPLRDKFPVHTPDVVWLEKLRSEGDWVVISGDQFGKSQAERRAISNVGIKTILLDPQWSQKTHWVKAAQLILWWPMILAEVRNGGSDVVRLPWKRTSQKSFKAMRAR